MPPTENVTAPQGVELKMFVLEKNIELLRHRLRTEDDVAERLRLWGLVREMELAQQRLSVAHLCRAEKPPAAEP